MLSPGLPNRLSSTNKNPYSCSLVNDDRVSERALGPGEDDGCFTTQPATPVLWGSGKGTGLESADLSSGPGLVTTELSDLVQVTSRLCASFLFRKICVEGGDLKYMISPRPKKKN